MDLVINNDDLLNEILLRLPAKSLIRFKSVRKKWLSLFSSDQFCHQHTLRRPRLQPSSLLIITTTPEKKLFYSDQTINGGKLMMTRTPYHMSSSVERHRIIQACNGLLLLESLYVEKGHYGLYYDPLTNERDPKWSYYVYNPATRQSREIALAENAECPRVAVTSLAFDPSKSPYYKIVCIRYKPHLRSPFPISLYTYMVEVYDSESHSWKVSPLEVAAFVYNNIRSAGIYWNNSIYWDIFGTYHRFDIGKNEIKQLLFPRTLTDIPRGVCIASNLQESKGRLYIIQIICDMEVYEMGLVTGRQGHITVAMWELGRDEDGNDHHSRLVFKDLHCSSKVINTNFLRLTTVGSGSGSGSGSGADGDGDGDETCRLLVHQDGKVRAYNFLDKSYEDHLFDSETEPLVFQFGEILAVV